MRQKRFASCHPDQPHAAKGLCRVCYKLSIRQNNRQKYRAYALKHYYRNKEKRLKQVAQWARNNKVRKYGASSLWNAANPERIMVKSAKSRAKKKGLVFDLTHVDIIIPDVCPVLGIPLKPNMGKYGPNSPTIDRIDNTKGYTKDNIIIVSYRANHLKSDGSIEELKKILEFYSSFKSH